MTSPKGPVLTVVPIPKTDAPGPQVLQSEPVRPAGAVATVEIEVDRTYRAPGDLRDLGVVVTAAGFR